MARTIFKSSAVKTAITTKLSVVIREHLTGLGYEFDNGYEGAVQNPHDDADIVSFHAEYMFVNSETDKNVLVDITQVQVAHYRRDRGLGKSSGRFTAQIKLERCEVLGMARYSSISCHLQDHDLEEEETFKIMKL